MFSISEQFSSAVVLLTGATGYVGGLVLESLLRTTSVSKVYVLLRDKGGSSAEARLSQLLQKPIFHKVREQRHLLAKVSAVTGDLTQPGLGLAAGAAQQLQQQLQLILHCAADIRLEVDIQTALRSNYLGTQEVLQLASACKQLKGLVHTSSCFVNMNQPRSSVVQERIYPLKFGDREVDCEELVQDLLCLPSAAAEVRASALGLRWSFPNNYTLSKHLAEQLVWRYQQQHGVPASIVRPSLVCAVAYEPIPGYVGNWAGPIGASAALAIGFYHSLGCVSSQPLHVWDIMPGDLVANAVLAAAAATAAKTTLPLPAAAAAGSAASGSCKQPMLVVHSSSSSTYPMTLMEGWNAALEFIAVHKPNFRLSWGLPPAMTPAFQPDPAVVRRQRRWTALKVAAACALLRLFGMGRAAARLRSGFEALCVYGTSKTDKDLVFSADNLLLLEAHMPEQERRSWPLVMRPGTPLPSTAAAAAAAGVSSSSRSESDALLDCPGGEQQPQPQVLSWRRYFHTQFAGVYSTLFRSKVPQLARRSNGAAVEHDFVFVR
ncbi:hypothetical protein OEZ86_003073 [Tetradesmus obliquus]|nr:hypothetical protein OEZ86_003073 [Tetradesmus obliquus]